MDQTLFVGWALTCEEPDVYQSRALTELTSARREIPLLTTASQARHAPRLTPLLTRPRPQEGTLHSVEYSRPEPAP